MISKDTVEEFAKAMADTLHRQGVRTTDWTSMNTIARNSYRRAVTEAFQAIGVKVEGQAEK